MSGGKQAVAETAPALGASSGALTRLVALIAAVIGVIALALGGPSLMGALTEMRVNNVLAKAAQGAQPPPEQLEKMVESSYAGSVWHGDSRVWIAMGDARLASAKHEHDEEELQRRLLDRAVFAYERGLTMAPGNSLGWMRLGETLLMRTGPSPRAARALVMSVKQGRVAPEFSVERLGLLLALWDLYDEKGRALIEDQIRLAQRNPRTARPAAALLSSFDAERLIQISNTGQH